MSSVRSACRHLSVFAALCLLLTFLTACSGGITREEAKTADLTVEVIRNDKGYGIFQVECNP